MKAATGVLFSTSLVAAALALAVPARAEAPTGGTYVTTLPTGAEIWCDGSYVGRSPLLIDGLAEGRHSLEILKSGWTAREASIGILRGTVVMSSSRLTVGKRASAGDPAGTGTLILRDAPPGADIALDGATLGNVPARGVVVPAGTHEIAVTSPRGRTTREIAIYPDVTTDVILRETPGKRGRSGVVAPAEDYLPTDAFAVDSRRIVVRYGGHVVVAHFGETTYRIDGASTAFDSAPESIGGKLYLPLALLEKLSGDVSNGR